MIVIVFDPGLHNGMPMTAPQPFNHHASSGAFSCMSCHNGKWAFGGEDLFSLHAVPPGDHLALLFEPLVTAR